MISQPAPTRLSPGLWFLALTPFLFMLGWFWTSGSGPFLDDPGLYLMHAEALAEGRSYTDVKYLDSQLIFSPSLQPPGLPVTLAAVMLLFGGFNAVAVKLVMVLLALPFIVLPGLYFAREHGRAIGIATVAFLGVAHGWLSLQILSDLGFASLFWVLICILDRTERFEWKHVAALLALGTWALSFRFLAASIVPGMFVYGLLHYRRAGIRPLIPPLLWGGGAIVGLTVLGAWGAVLGPIGLGHPMFPGHLRQQLVGAFIKPAGLAHLDPLPIGPLGDSYHLLALAVTLIGLVAWTRTSWRSAAWILSASYLGAILSSWATSARYMIPLYPVLVFGLLNGVTVLAGWARRRWDTVHPQRVTAVVATVIVLAGAWGVVRQPRPADPTALATHVEMREYLVTERATTEVRLMIGQPRIFAWETGIPSMELTPQTADEVIPEIEDLGITHIVVDEVLGTSRRVQRMIDSVSCRFELVLSNDGYRVYRVLPECVESRDPGSAIDP